MKYLLLLIIPFSAFSISMLINSFKLDENYNQELSIQKEKEYIFEEQRSAAENLAPRLRKNAKGDLVMGKALETAADQGRKRFTQDRERVRKDADRMKKERQIHSYEVLNALDKVEDEKQLEIK